MLPATNYLGVLYVYARASSYKLNLQEDKHSSRRWITRNQSARYSVLGSFTMVL